MKSLIALCAVAAASSISGIAEARDAQANLQISARVESFCRIDGAIADALTIGDITSLGTIREVCNTQGYIVRASFSNLRGGTVVAGRDRAMIDDGFAEFRYTQAQALTRVWQLQGAEQRDVAAPVYLTVSITPL